MLALVEDTAVQATGRQGLLAAICLGILPFLWQLAVYFAVARDSAKLELLASTTMSLLLVWPVRNQVSTLMQGGKWHLWSGKAWHGANSFDGLEVVYTCKPDKHGTYAHKLSPLHTALGMQ